MPKQDEFQQFVYWSQETISWCASRASEIQRKADAVENVTMIESVKEDIRQVHSRTGG